MNKRVLFMSMILAACFSFSSLQAMHDSSYDQQSQDYLKKQLADRRAFLCVYLSKEIRNRKRLGFNVLDYIFNGTCSGHAPHPSFEEIKKLYKERNITLPCSRQDYQELLNEEEELYGLRKDAPFFAPIVSAPTVARDYPIIKPLAQRKAPEQTTVSNNFRREMTRFIIRRRGRRYDISIRPGYQPLEVVSLP